jgi:RNA 2',3'-cyclic 3'-phosphodiesterase
VRLFVAIELEAAARALVAAEQNRLKRAAGSDGLRWVDESHLHLTLVFLGEVAEPEVAAVTRAVSEPIPLKPFVLSLGGVGVFPSRGAPRVLWLGAAAGGTETAAVQRAVAERVISCGIRIEDRPFHPHLTLARWRDPGSGRRAARQLTAKGQRPTEVARVEVTHTTLFRSTLSPRGSTYTRLATAPLAGHPLE